MGKQVHPAGDAFGDGDVERAAAKVIDDEYAVVLALAHDAHHGGHWLLHQCNTSEASRVSSGHRRVLLHLVECGWNRDHGACVAVSANLLRQVTKERAQHLGGTLLRRHGEVDGG